MTARIKCDANPLPAEDEDPGPDPFAGQRRHAPLRHGDITLWMRVRIASGSAAGHVGRVSGYAPDAGGMSYTIGLDEAWNGRRLVTARVENLEVE